MATDERAPLLGSQREGVEADWSNHAPKDDGDRPIDPCELIDLTRRERIEVVMGAYAAVALVSLDTTIVASLVNPIAASFNESHNSSYLGTAYLLAGITFTPLYGRLCDIIGRRAANGLAISLFTLGTAGCCFAPSLRLLILFRFLAGAGGGGINMTSSIIVGDLFTLKQRGSIGAMTTAIRAIGSASGGPLGGFMSDLLGWRSAFVFQIPLLLYCLYSGLHKTGYVIPGAKQAKESVREKLARIDFIGSGCIFVSMGAALVLLGQKNNDNVPWSNPLVIATSVLAPLFFAIFLVNEGYWAKEPILAFRILRQRTPLLVMLIVVLIAITNFCLMFSFPVYFLAVEGTTAGEAGAHLAPASVCAVLGGGVAGYVIHRTGRYRLASAAAGALAASGIAIIATLTPASPTILKWIPMAIWGFGQNHILNTSTVALMASVPHSDLAVVTGVMWVFRSTGQVAGVALSGAILQNFLTRELTKRITGKGAAKAISEIRQNSSIIASLPHHLRDAARQAYAIALRHAFVFCTITATLAWVCICLVPDIDLERRAEPISSSPDAAGESDLHLIDEAEESIAERRVEADAEARV